MHLIFKFDNEVRAREVFYDAGLVITMPPITFRGDVTYPVDFGSTETTSSYFVIMYSEDLNVPSSLMQYEYDYKYPISDYINHVVG